MYVCICRGVTDTRIHSEVANGATTMKQLSVRLGVATGCGQCADQARALLAEAVHEIVRGDGETSTGYWEPAA